jgi:hypothetical protein
VAAGCIDVIAVRCIGEMRACPGFDACCKVAVTVFEERPRQCAMNIHVA